MPISESQIYQLNPYQLSHCLEQLSGRQLNYFDGAYIYTMLDSPRGYLNERRHRENIQRMLTRYTDILEYPPRDPYEARLGSFENVERALDGNTYTQPSHTLNIFTTFSPAREIIAPGAFDGVAQEMRQTGQRIQQNMERLFYDGANSLRPTPTPSPARYVPAWELSFWKEIQPNPDWTAAPIQMRNQERYLIHSPQEEPSVSMQKITLGQIAEKLPSGVVGLHQINDKPFNLVFRPSRENDPRLKYLRDWGWFPVRKHENVWWAATTLEAYNILYDSGLEFSITPKVAEWLEQATKVEAQNWPQDCPLFDYQKDGVSFLAMRDRAMLSLSPGLGKTLTSAYAASLDKSIRIVLLVCPASLLYYWKAELEKWAEYLQQKPVVYVQHRSTLWVEELPQKGEQLWIISNPETVVKYNLDQGFFIMPDLLLVDESIMYKHRDSQRAAAVKDLAARIRKVWLLTGAPATRYLDDMWHQLHILDQRGYASYWRFAKTYCLIEETQWANIVIANRRNAEEQLKENLQDIYFARNQEEVTDIPPWLFEDIDIAMTDKQQEVYDKLRKDLLIHLEGVPDSEPLRVKSHISLMLRSLQVLSNPVLVGSVNTSGKWSALNELMYIYPGPYIVWFNFVRTGELLLEALTQRLGSGKVALVNGATPMEERNATVESLQQGNLEAIVLNNTVGKFGFNLTKARTAFFVERMYDDSYFQSLHRNRRIGTTVSPIIVNMRSVSTLGKRTLDHAVHDTLDYRTGMIKSLTIGDIRRALQ